MSQNSKGQQNIDIRLFYSGGRGDGWASRLVDSLEVDSPVALMEHAPSSTAVPSAVSSLSAAAKRKGVKVATRTIDGTVYVMRLHEDPAQA